MFLYLKSLRSKKAPPNFLWAIAISLMTISVTSSEVLGQQKHSKSVRSLFLHQDIISNFSNMHNIYPAVRLKAGTNGETLPESLSALPQNYQYGGEVRELSGGLEKLKTTSLMVLHKGEIKFEGYFENTSKDDVRIIWSITKSVISALVGIVLEEGKIDSLDDRVDQYVPELKNSAYKNVKIRDVLRMSSGVAFNEDPFDFQSDMHLLGQDLAQGASISEFVKSYKEIIRKPGIKRDYVSLDTQVLAIVLRAATGQKLPELLYGKLWSKLGVKNDAFILTDQHGIALAFAGLNMQTRDLARFGLLYLNGGRLNNQQILSSDWVSLSTKVTAPNAANPLDKFQFGYQWWIPPGADEEYFAKGAYGQYLYINPKAHVVIVKTAANAGARFGETEENIAIFRAISEHYSDWKYLRPYGKTRLD